MTFISIFTTQPPGGEPAPVPPPVIQFHADCQHATYATDQLVCSVADLKTLDGALAQAFLEARKLKGAGLDAGQAAWFRKRSLCAFRPDQEQCTRKSYLNRIRALKRLQRR